ncbi:MAG: M3 family oligoendopeptidase, partial [Abditibacteriota bacterium]|nr:M3 family oligoendopeptidase [Abditibacteriota bacterium]
HVTWDLSGLYSGPDDGRIDGDLGRAKELAEAFAGRCKGNIAAADGETLLAAMKEYTEILTLCYNPDLYALLVFSADTSAPENGALMQRVSEQVSAVSVTLLFFDLELMAMPEEKLRAAFEECPALSEYAHYIGKVRAFNPYKLSEPEERILEEKANTGRRAFDRLFDQVLSAAVFRGRVKGEDREMNEAEVLSLLRSPDRGVREDAAHILTEGLKEHSGVLSFIFNTMVYDKSVDDRLRGFGYPQQSRHLSNELSRETVDLVIKTCRDNYPLVSRFYRRKRALLGLRELTHIDRYAPLAAAEKEVSFEEAKDIVLSSFAGFSDRFASIARDFFDKRWIDAEPRQGKRGGAFCAHADPARNPYVLMSYMNRQDDVMTLAHELGHGIHAVLASRQNILDCSATLPIAENASTFGEMLVFEALVREASREDKIALYAEKIESVFATVFRQAAMYIFECRLHEARRSRGELSVEDIGSLWQDSLQEMFGDSLILGDEHRYWWIYVSHFIGTPFYVYAYSFGELMVLSLFALYKKTGAPFVAKYEELLSGGGSKAPGELLCSMGFDITDPAFWQGGMDYITGLIDEFEALCDN